MSETPPPPSKGTYLVCVSDHQESETALYYACTRARFRKSRVSILHVMEPTAYQGLQSITDKMREEKMEEAEQLISNMAAAAHDGTGITPSLVIKEGNLGEQILQTLQEDSDINMLVLGLRPESDQGPKLISWLTDRLGATLLVPMVLVPGNLTKAQIQQLA